MKDSIQLETVFRPRLNQFYNITFTKTNSFYKQVVASIQSDLRERKETINNLIIGLNCLKILCLKICSAGKTSYIHENSIEARDVLGDPRLTWAEIKKNADGTKKQSECMIRYRALREKNKNKKNDLILFHCHQRMKSIYKKKILLVQGLESKTFRLVWGMVYPLCQIM